MADNNGNFYVGVNNVAQTASKIYLGVNGVAKCVYDSAGGGEKKTLKDLFTTTSISNIKGYAYYYYYTGSGNSDNYRGFTQYDELNTPNYFGTPLEQAASASLSNYGLSGSDTNARKFKSGLTNSETGYYLSLMHRFTGSTTAIIEGKLAYYSSTGNSVLTSNMSTVSGNQNSTAIKLNNLNTNILSPSTTFMDVVAMYQYRNGNDNYTIIDYSNSGLSGSFSSFSFTGLSNSDGTTAGDYGFIKKANGSVGYYTRTGYYLEVWLQSYVSLGSYPAVGYNLNYMKVSYDWHKAGDMCYGHGATSAARSSRIIFYLGE